MEENTTIESTINEDAAAATTETTVIKAATFDDLIAKALKKKEAKDKTEEITVSSMGTTLAFERPADDLIVELLDEIGNDTKISSMVPAFKRIIYLSCDMLQDTNLQAQLEVKDPFDTVEALFDLGDILEIGEKLMDLLNIGKKSEEIKNS